MIKRTIDIAKTLATAYNLSGSYDSSLMSNSLYAGVFTSEVDVIKHTFIKLNENKIKIISSSIQLSFNMSTKKLLTLIESVIPENTPFQMCDFSSGQNVYYTYGAENAFILFIRLPSTSNSHYYQYDNSRTGSWIFDVIGIPDITEYIITNIKNKLNTELIPSIRWHFSTPHGASYENINISLTDRKEVRDSFYPWLETGVNTYLDSYVESKSPILLMAGPPGTGKTSLLRHFLFKYQKIGYQANITYDERILNSDTVFIDFITSLDPQILIVEDADVLLTSRDSDANKMISKFLNVSDGLIPLHNKKIVFTTNLTDFQRIDSALIRPGRCFDFMHCRNLTINEANKVATEMNIPLLNREASLAEIFFNKKNINLPRMGFV